MTSLSPPQPGELPSGNLLGIKFSLASPAQAVESILQHRRSGYVCFANVHVVMEAHNSSAFKAVLGGAWQVFADGKPVAAALCLHGHRAQQVRGPSVAEVICARAARDGIAIGMYGGRPEVMAELQRILPLRYPGLRIAYAWSPPFRPLTPAENAAARQAIRDSGAQLLLVGLGCPKQERWMHEASAELPMPLLGVGAWFDFSSGAVGEAPRWLQACSLEWFYRLCQEPRRLWKRYAVHNPHYCWLVLASLVRHAVSHCRPAGSKA